MIDKAAAKIKRYPFQTGIVVGVLACLLIVGFISLFQDHGRTLSGNSEVIREDYLRMSINEYGNDNNGDLAAWRYDHLGSKADETLRFMRSDESVSPQLLVRFAESIGKTDKIGEKTSGMNGSAESGTPTNPKKGLSGFGKVLLIILGLGVVAAGGLYAASLIQTKNKQKRRAEANRNFDEGPINMITPDKAASFDNTPSDALFDLDSLFPQTQKDETPGEQEGDNIHQEKLFGADESPENAELSETAEDSDKFQNPANDDSEKIINEAEPAEDEKSDDDLSDDDQPIQYENVQESDNSNDETVSDTSPAFPQAEEKISERENENDEPGLEYETTSHDFENDRFEADTNAAGDDKSEPINSVEQSNEPAEKDEQKSADAGSEEISDGNDAEKPLVETDSDNEPENEDELLKMIRAGKSGANDEKIEVIEKTADDIVPDDHNDVSQDEQPAEKSDDQQDAVPDESNASDFAENTDDILIHYQSQYRIGNDMYDEVFSIDQGDTFRGECGIGIGETLNNTEPKAVTAFEVWLFDKDDIHTATWYLMSDFAMSNEGISKRLEQRGKCDRIRKGDLYTLETETLVVDIKIIELEYGNEMEEKNSYFTNVIFDVIARQKPQE